MGVYAYPEFEKVIHEGDVTVIGNGETAPEPVTSSVSD
jgi:hypothetical protein